MLGWSIQPADELVLALNARMRRIDLLCKLLGPLAISSIAVISTNVAIWTTLGMNLGSILPEYICIAQVCLPPICGSRYAVLTDLGLRKSAFFTYQPHHSRR